MDEITTTSQTMADEVWNVIQDKSPFVPDFAILAVRADRVNRIGIFVLPSGEERNGGHIAEVLTSLISELASQFEEQERGAGAQLIAALFMRPAAGE